MSSIFHLQKYRHDKETHDYLLERTPTFKDWEVITLFYSALHLIETYFANHGPYVPKRHEDRENLVEQFLNPIYDVYSKLYIICKKARYDAPISNGEVADASSYYVDIANFIKPLI